ncbi:DEAD/DEAH box helicase [Arthrobacter castelli]|uniref:DEAD/DEAH box helicase n=1 Tax=Arthrobacter castelli TaxID=271431 RepID=UPI0003F86F45|nr:DEAD/DEAH box helicase [Arthrobacter castelli]
MAPSSFPLVDVGDIIRHVGGAAFARAQSYARDDSVAELEFDDVTGRVTSRVYGTAAIPYRCRIQLVRMNNGRHRPEDSSCSCPMVEQCKHVAATLLHGNTNHMLSSNVFSDSRQPQSGLQEESESRQKFDWRQSLTGLLDDVGPSQRSTSPDGGRQAITPLGLQFDLAAPPARVPAPWRSARRQENPKPAGRQLRPVVRPVMLNSNGRWVKNNLRWNTISYKTYGLNLDPEQHRWFSQFAPLHRANGLAYYGEDNDWLQLDEFSSPLLWQLLKEAERLGIELVGARKNLSVVVGQQAVLGMDARLATGDGGGSRPGSGSGSRDSSGPGGDLTLAPTVEIDGDPHPVETSGTIGHHGIYSYSTTDPKVITLAPVAKPLAEQERQLLADTNPLTIPADEVDHFLEDFYPALSQRVEVASSDSSVCFPEVVPPVLVLTATYGPANTLGTAWDWEYTHGQRTSRKPLRPEPGETGHRDHAAEAALMNAACRALQIRELPADATFQNFDAVDFTEQMLPRVEELEGVRVDIVGERPDYRELTETPELTVSTVETDQSDWFDLGVLVTVEGRKVPFNDIFKALTRGERKIMLVDKTYLSLEQPIFDRLRRLVDEALLLQGRTQEKKLSGSGQEPVPDVADELRISRYQAGLWAELEELAEETEQARAWRQSVSGLLELESVEQTAVPAAVQADLRPYQVDGFNWLAFLWHHGLGGVLADDMGLGKTLQTLSLLVHRKEVAGGSTGNRPFLVVAPTSVVPNWVAEATKFAPGLNVIGISESRKRSRQSLEAQAASADVVVTSYALFRIDFEAYQKIRWDGLVLDEAQFVKNRTAKVHRCARDLQAPFKLAITGTPMENNLMELHSIFSIVAPGLFPISTKFAEQYQRPIERNGDKDLLAQLRRRIRPLMMRRTKEAVAADLPAKQEQHLEVELGSKHQKIYQTHLQAERQKILRLVEDMDRNRFTIFQSLTLLRLLSLDASLVDDEYAAVPSAKLDALFEQLGDVVGEGHRALVFSQFTSFLKKAAERLEAEGIDYCYLDGSTRHRAGAIDRFKDGEAPVFLISLKAGGFGLNLTEADYCFLLDPWWNPATESQAVDRTHRIGQTKNVMVYRLVSRDTIEEKVMALKERKSQLFSSVMDDDGVFASQLTADDVRGLLA